MKDPDEDDRGKLKRLLKYLKGTIYLPLILAADSMSFIRWWIDASFAVHMDMKGQTGAMMSFGEGAVNSFSRKQKLNAKSSTEAEVIGVDDGIPAVLWTRYFVESQGYEVKQNVIGQDNISAALLEENGKASSSRRTKHMNIRYFFITNRVQAGEVTIERVPTDQMLSQALRRY